MQSKIYLHCGFHKTGTTALQAALRKHENSLKKAGFLFPYAGSLNLPNSPHPKASEAGHHNIAWEITRDRRYSRRHGGLKKLYEEIQGFKGDIILSSEDFESVFGEPDKFRGIQRLAQETGRKLVIIAYFRNQISYIESLFFQILNHGVSQEYQKLAESVVRSGYISVNDWQFNFDYEKIYKNWKSVPYTEIKIRSYHFLVGGSVIGDFSDLLGIGSILEDDIKSQVNKRESVARALAKFYQNRVEREVSLVEAARIRYLCRDIPSCLFSGPSLQYAFAERFNEANMRLCENAGLPPLSLAIPETNSMQSKLNLEQVFSFEVQHAIQFGAGIAYDAEVALNQIPLPLFGIENIPPLPLNFKKKLKFLLGHVQERLDAYRLHLLDSVESA